MKTNQVLLRGDNILRGSKHQLQLTVFAFDKDDRDKITGGYRHFDTGKSSLPVHRSPDFS